MGYVEQGVHGQRLLECCVVCVWISFCSSIQVQLTQRKLTNTCVAHWLFHVQLHGNACDMHTEKPMERIEKRFSCDGSGVQQLYLGGRMVTNSILGHFTTAAGLFLVRGDER